MKRFCQTVATAAAFALLSGCASMSANECATADWYGVGYEDGARGFTADAVGRHRKACAKAGVTTDSRQYEEGRQAGLRQFCNPSRAYELGRSGGKYAGVCPADLEDEFVIAFNEGRELFVLEDAVRSVENQLRGVERRIDRAEEELRDLEKKLISPDANTEERIQWLAEAKDVASDVGELESERDGLIYELGVRRERLEEYQSVRTAL